MDPQILQLRQSTHHHTNRMTTINLPHADRIPSANRVSGIVNVRGKIFIIPLFDQLHALSIQVLDRFVNRRRSIFSCGHRGCQFTILSIVIRVSEPRAPESAFDKRQIPMTEIARDNKEVLRVGNVGRQQAAVFFFLCLVRRANQDRHERGNRVGKVSTLDGRERRYLDRIV
jgi:hypothetical protein